MMLISGLFGALSLTLTTTGIFAVMLHTVNQRLVEMGVRVALGARRRDIAQLVFAYGLRILVMGLALGTTLTWVASRYIGSLLFEIEPWDLRTYAGGVVTLVVAVALACLIPARRAVTFDPARLLRS
jgi:ABC-type antimicrobial peptide transport system permease subunit